MEIGAHRVAHVAIAAIGDQMSVDVDIVGLEDLRRRLGGARAILGGERVEESGLEPLGVVAIGLIARARRVSLAERGEVDVGVAAFELRDQRVIAGAARLRRAGGRKEDDEQREAAADDADRAQRFTPQALSIWPSAWLRPARL
jgi:hypothetical protein